MYDMRSTRNGSKEREPSTCPFLPPSVRNNFRRGYRIMLSFLVCKPLRMLVVLLQLALVVFLIASFTGGSTRDAIHAELLAASQQRWVVRSKQNVTYEYTRASPLIWIGGVPRSGTTLMRVILDAHRDVRCGAETRVIPRMLSMRAQWVSSAVESNRLREAGVDESIMDQATASFIMEVLTRYEEPASVLCNKDPFALKYSTWLFRVFPNSRFVLMLRDGRAVVHSIIARQVTITGYDMKDYGKCLEHWNRSIGDMLRECIRLGSNVCMPVHYELLIIEPEKWIRAILEFLDLGWDDTVMRHHELVGVDGGIHVSKLERSTDQVKKPIYKSALTDWQKDFPKDVLERVRTIAPMLTALGYDTNPAINESGYASISERLDDLQASWKSISSLDIARNARLK